VEQKLANEQHVTCTSIGGSLGRARDVEKQLSAQTGILWNTSKCFTYVLRCSRDVMQYCIKLAFFSPFDVVYSTGLWDVVEAQERFSGVAGNQPELPSRYGFGLERHRREYEGLCFVPEGQGSTQRQPGELGRRFRHVESEDKG
jgi:hypothetical protein